MTVTTTSLTRAVLFGIALLRARVLARWASGLLVLGTLATLAIPVLPHSFERPLAVPTGVDGLVPAGAPS
jgi:hypothetical protein